MDDQIDPIDAPALWLAIGRRVRQRREEMGLSMRALAHRCRISKTGLLAIELGRSGGSAQTLRALADGLRVSLDWLCQRP